MAKYQFISLDTILAKYHRDFRGLGINEGDAIEWIGEALGLAKTYSNSEEAIAYMEVKNYQAEMPNGLHHIIQIAKSNRWTLNNKEECSAGIIVESLGPDLPCTDCDGEIVEIDYDNDDEICEETPLTTVINTQLPIVTVDCNGDIINDYDVAYYRPFFDLQYEYLGWAHRTFSGNAFSPVKLANHTFFNSLVCTVPGMEGLYQSCQDEYTIIGNSTLRFSFKDGFVAVAYTRQVTDPETGYPMIPDDESVKSAITYYLAWKFKQREAYNHREGAMQLSKDAEQQWLKYIKQFKAKSKMPQSVDDLESMKNESSYLLPRRRRFDNFFGKLGTEESRDFNTPSRRFSRANY